MSRRKSPARPAWQVPILIVTAVFAGGLLFFSAYPDHWRALFPEINENIPTLNNPTTQQKKSEAKHTSSKESQTLSALGSDFSFSGGDDRAHLYGIPSSIPITASLKKEGYAYLVSRFEIRTAKAQSTLVQGKKSGIYDALGNLLLSVAEKDGDYALRLSEYKNLDIYPGSITLIHLLRVNQKGKGMSDEITLYWKPSQRAWALTNTFGDEDTF